MKRGLSRRFGVLTLIASSASAERSASEFDAACGGMGGVARDVAMIRYQSLDALRGFAVMGILLMNIIAFAMPEGAYISPAAYGGTSTPDIVVWAAAFILVDSKMRALFSILFGASMLLVYDRAQSAGEDGVRVHIQRMIWLVIFGLIHYFFIWNGDILTLYGLCGIIGVLLLGIDPARMIRTTVMLFAFAFAILGLTVGGFWVMQIAATAPGAAADSRDVYTGLIEAIVPSSSVSIQNALTLYRGDYWGITADKLANDLFVPIEMLLASGFETLGLMALGMILLRNGFLTGAWDDAAYARVMRRAYGFGIPPLIGLAYWAWSTGFDPLVMISNLVLFALPFSFIVAIGHAALLMRVIKSQASSGLIIRIGAAGQMAFTNYIGTSLLMTLFFYGYGFGWFGILSRAQAYLVVPLVWLVMLMVSKPWLERYRYGPLEYMWRSAARRAWQPLRRG